MATRKDTRNTGISIRCDYIPIVIEFSRNAVITSRWVCCPQGQPATNIVILKYTDGDVSLRKKRILRCDLCVF